VVSPAGHRRYPERAVVDDAFHHDRRSEPLHAGQGGEFLVAQGLVRGQVGGGDSHQVIGVAEQPFRVAYLGDVGQAALEPRDRRRVFPLHGDLHEHLEAEADRGRVDDGPITADRPGALQFAQPPVARRHAEGDSLSQFGDGEAPLRLKLSKNLSINRIHIKDYCGPLRIMA
jgi:hypothetical protein